MKRWFPLILLCVALGGAKAEPESASKPVVQARPVLRVSLRVSGDERLAAKVRGYLARALRRLDDVVISDNQPHVELIAVADPSRLTNGTPVRDHIAFAVLTNVRRAILEDAARKSIAPNEAFMEMLHQQSQLGAVRLHSQPPAKTQEACDAFVEEFDGEVLQRARQDIQSYREGLAAVEAANGKSKDEFDPDTAVPDAKHLRKESNNPIDWGATPVEPPKARTKR